MKGTYTIRVRRNRVTYSLILERNITIICGNSATGKTTLYQCIADYEEYGAASGIHLESRKECHVLEGRHWQSDLASFSDSFVFVDEGNSFLKSRDFAEAIKNTDNYYVLITRENLYQLPYSVNSVLVLKQTTSRFKHTYSRTYPRYEHIDAFRMIVGNMNGIITEDSNSGYDLYSVIADKNGISCISAGGKSGILPKLKEAKGKRIIVAADGAAFGAEMAEIYHYLKLHENELVLYLPESTEWVILSSGVLHDTLIEEILSNPSDFIDSRQYFSWEQFFTELLTQKTRNTPAAYDKRKLADFYLKKENLEKIIRVISGDSLEQ